MKSNIPKIIQNIVKCGKKVLAKPVQTTGYDQHIVREQKYMERLGANSQRLDRLQNRVEKRERSNYDKK